MTEQEITFDAEEVACDLCGETDSVPLYTLRDTLHHVPGEFVLRRCARCGLMYLSPRPTPRSISSYYPQDYAPYRPAIEDERFAVMRWVRQRKLTKQRRLIERYLGQTAGRVLDVGCATGIFLHEMQRVGWQAAGIEPIASAADFARRRFGLEVFQGMLGEAGYAPESFDAVTLWDVLEHTFSPATELAHAARLLRPGGLLALSVPNWDSPDRRIFGRHWQGLDSPRHLFVFTRDTLTRLLAQAGFSVLARVCFIPSYYSFIMSLQRWLATLHPPLSRFTDRVLRIPGMRFPFEPWFTLNSWLGKGAIVSVFARRTGVPSGASGRAMHSAERTGLESRG